MLSPAAEGSPFGASKTGPAPPTPLGRTPARLLVPQPQPPRAPPRAPTLALQTPPKSQSSTPPDRPLCLGSLPPTPHSPSPSPARPRSEQEPDADEYLAKLLRLSRAKAPPPPPPPTMTDFLASFNLGPEAPAAPGNASCGDANELQLRLQAALGAKTTPTRAEHVSLALELGAAAQFALNLSESDNEALEGLGGVDPALGGARWASVDQGAGGQAMRVVTASETLESQPHDNPVLQRAVAKHIIGAVSATDASAWTVREVSRASQGWTFTYVCKDSFQQWSRQNSKNKTKAVIGEYSQKEPDPRLADRPAFDCRGTITIAFSRSSRSITVQYDHTPIHKTVSQLAELFKPSPRQLGPGAVAQQQKTPKKRESAPALDENGNSVPKRKRQSAPALDENGNPIPKRKRQSAPALDENGDPIPKRKRQSAPALGENGDPIPKRKRQSAPVLDENGNPVPRRKRQSAPALDENGNPIPKKRKKKNTGDAQLVPAGPVMPPDYPGATSGDGASQPGLSHQQSTNGDVQGFNNYPQALVGDAANAGQGKSAANKANFPINVTPEEAERRREFASNMLRSGGVEPDTLSTDQFNIFANQSPDLQKESLTMLARYGAERLRIVHPSNRDSSASAPASASATPKQTTQPTPSGPMTTKELVPQSQDTASPKGSRKSKAATNGITSGEGDGAQETPDNRTGWRGGKSRVACYQCKQRKVKCPHEKPTCAECETAGMTCEYPPVKPRPKKKKSDAVVTIEDDEDGESEMQDTQPEQMQQDEDSTHVADYSSTHMPVGDLITPNTEASGAQTTQAPYFQSNLLPQPDLSHMTDPPVPMHTGLVLPTDQTYDSTWNQPAPSAMDLTQQHEPTVAKAASPKQNKRRPNSSTSGGRRSLPTEVQQPRRSPVVNPLGTTDWSSVNRMQSPAVPANTISPTMQNQTGVRQQNSRAPLFGSAIDSATMPRASAQRPESPNLVAATQSQARRSPFQQSDGARSGSRLGQKAQSRTPQAGQSKARGIQAPPPRLEPDHDAATRQVAADLTEMAGYNSLGRYADGGATNGASSNRITYEPYSHQKAAGNTSSYPSYDYSRNTATAMSMTAQPETTVAPAQYSGNAHSDPWMGSQNRDTQHHHDTSASLQGFNMGTANPPSRSDLGSLNRRNQQSYGSFASQPQQQGGQGSQHQPSWYGLHGLPEDGNQRYDWKMAGQTWAGMP